MKATLICRTAKQLEEARRAVESEGFEVAHALLRKAGQPLEVLLADGDGDLLVVEAAGADPAADLSALETLTGRHPALAVILLSANRGPETLLAAMRAGIREVLQSPPGPTELAGALRRVALRRPATDGANQGRVVAFVACKGGSGATFLATNLAYLLATEHKKNTAFIDLDLQYGDASYFMTDGPGKSNIADLARQVDRLDAQLLASSMLNIAPNFHLLAAPEEPEAALSLTARHLERVLDVARASHDFVVLDLQRMLDAVAIKALDMSEVVFLVMENMIPFVRDAKRLVGALRALGYPDGKLRLVVNRYEKAGAVNLAQLEKAVGLKVSYTIPNSFEDVAESINTGVPLTKLSPHNPVTRSLREIAGELVEKPASKSRGWIGRLMSERA